MSSKDAFIAAILLSIKLSTTTVKKDAQLMINKDDLAHQSYQLTVTLKITVYSLPADWSPVLYIDPHTNGKVCERVLDHLLVCIEPSAILVGRSQTVFCPTHRVALLHFFLKRIIQLLVLVLDS